MAKSRLAEIYGSELKSGRGAFSGLGTAIGKRALEKIDIRNALFGGSGIGSQMGRAIFGKGYSATPRSGTSRTRQNLSSNISIDTSSIVQRLDTLNDKADDINANLKIIAKSSITLPSINHDTNVIRSNVGKIVTLLGGQATRKTDMFFKTAEGREADYESKFEKEKPTKVEAKVEEKPEEKKNKFLKMIENIIGPVALASITAIMEGVISSLKSFFSPANILKQIVTKFPLALIIGSITNGFLDGFKEWEESGDLGKAAIKFLSGMTFGLLDEKFIQDNIITPLVDFVEKIGELWTEYVTKPIENFVDSLKKMFNDYIVTPITNVWSTLKDGFINTINSMIDSIADSKFLPDVVKNQIKKLKVEKTPSGSETTTPAATAPSPGPTPAATAPSPAPTSSTRSGATPAKFAETTGGAVTGKVTLQGNNKQLVLSELQKAGFSEKAQANILAQVQAESGFKPRSEEIEKYTPETLVRLWPNKFPNIEAAKEAIAKGPVALGDILYGNRKDLGNDKPGDGYKYRGRGFLQITGKDAYTRIGKAIGVDLVNNPDLANDPAIAAKIVPAFFTIFKGKRPEQLEDINAVNTLVGSADMKSREKRISLAQSFQSELSSGSSPSTVASAPTTGSSIAATSSQVATGQRTEMAAAATPSAPSTTTVATQQQRPQQSSKDQLLTADKARNTSFMDYLQAAYIAT